MMDRIAKRGNVRTLIPVISIGQWLRRGNCAKSPRGRGVDRAPEHRETPHDAYTGGYGLAVNSAPKCN
jgi:hypothetical protein